MQNLKTEALVLEGEAIKNLKDTETRKRKLKLHLAIKI